VQITVSISENRTQIDGRMAEIQAKDGAVHCIPIGAWRPIILIIGRKCFTETGSKLFSVEKR
jgi:hypothetical protein